VFGNGMSFLEGSGEEDRDNDLHRGGRARGARC
jgi:hypothetical protein